MRRTVEAHVIGDIGDRTALAARQPFMGTLQPRVHDPFGHGFIPGFEQHVQIAQRHAIGGGDPLQRQIAVAQMGQDPVLKIIPFF